MYLVIRKSDTEQLLHHFASGYQIDQRNVFRMEEMAENKTCQPTGYNIIADDLRHTEKRCLKRSRPRCDQRRITMTEERIGFSAISTIRWTMWAILRSIRLPAIGRNRRPDLIHSVRTNSWTNAPYWRCWQAAAVWRSKTTFRPC